MDMQALLDMFYKMLEQKRGAGGNVMAPRKPSPLETPPAASEQRPAPTPAAQAPTPEDELTNMQLRRRGKAEAYNALDEEARPRQ